MSRKKRYNPKRRGAVVVLVAVALVTLFMCASLAIDVGYICALTAEQQNNADASALAGASGLQDEDAAEADRRAFEFLALNQRPQGYESLDDQLVEYGWWDSVNLVFNAVDDLDDAFAVRVRAARNDARLFFAPLMGHSSTDVSRFATAVGSKPCGGIWGLEGITAGSVNTDSYDSTEGPYAVGTAGDHGSLCSGRGITVEGSFDVNGDIMTGLGYPLIVNGSSGRVTGLTTSGIEDIEPPPADLGDAVYTNDNAAIGLTENGRSPWARGGGWNLRVSGDNLTIPGGTYYFDSIALSGGATLTTDGPVTFYVGGDIDATGGALLNSGQDPSALTIMSLGDNVKLAGGSVFYGSILAPLAEVKVTSNAEYFGALVARFVKLGGDFTAHVDESLPLAQPWFTPPPPILVE